MALKIGIPKETAKDENRVAFTPDAVKRLLSRVKGVEILVEKGAGAAAHFPDAAYKETGAKAETTEKVWQADVVLKVTPPTLEEATTLKKGALLMGFLDSWGNEALLKKLATRGVTALAVERIPRISRAQGMDGLSSQANIAGYRAVIEAAAHYGRFFPLMMTAAGSSKPARVIVLGAGVAGLQAIATARRLGAQVEAFDVRPEVKEQVESLGAKFIELDLGESGSGEGGYAKELSAAAKKKQQELLQGELARANIVITTAQIPGKPAPELVTEATVKAMAPGSVIVDLAAATGGNCKLSQAGKVVEKHGVKLVGHTNYPSQMPQDASSFYSMNLINILNVILKEKNGKTACHFDLEDAVVVGALVVHNGKVR